MSFISIGEFYFFKNIIGLKNSSLNHIGLVSLWPSPPPVLFRVVVSHRALALPRLSSPTKNLHFTSFETLKSFYKTKTKKSEWDLQDYSLWRRLSCPTVRETFLYRDLYEEFLFQGNMQTEVIRGQVGSFKGTREELKMDQIGSEICPYLSNGQISKVWWFYYLIINLNIYLNWIHLD